MSLRHTLQLSLLLSLLFSTPTLHAATEFDDGLVPAELLQDLVGYPVVRFSRGLPDDFPLPPQFPPGLQLRLLGSMQQDAMQRLFLRSPQAADVVLDGLRQAYTTAGWRDVSNNTALTSSLTLCHDTHGQLQVMSPMDNTTSKPGTTTLAAYYFNSRAPQSCAAQVDARDAFEALQTASAALFPVLEVPPQTLATPVPGLLPRGLSYSAHRDGFRLEMERKGQIEVPDTDLAGLYEHFAAQLRDQGWQRDSGSVGLRSAASVWYHQDAAAEFEALTPLPVEAYGTLVVIDYGEDRYRVGFALTVLGGSIGPDFNVVGVYPGFQ